VVGHEPKNTQSELLDLCRTFSGSLNSWSDLILNQQHGISSGAEVIANESRSVRRQFVDFFQLVAKFKTIQLMTVQRNNIDLLLREVANGMNE
jgi:hypothetical protein